MFSIWHIVRTGEIDYDENVEMVVIAANEQDAREFATEEVGDESPSEWTSARRSLARKLGNALEGMSEGVVVAQTRDG